MKNLLIPGSILALLLCASLWNAAVVEEHTQPCRAALEQSAAAAEAGDWGRALALLSQTRAAWEEGKTWLHIVTAHDELGKADELFAAAACYGAARERAEFCAAASELAVQMEVVAALQRLTVRNIL